jgi:hypothetical protein
VVPSQFLKVLAVKHQPCDSVALLPPESLKDVTSGDRCFTGDAENEEEN